MYYVSKEVIIRADRVERAGEVLRADGLVALRGGREAALAAAQDEGVAVALMPSLGLHSTTTSSPSTALLRARGSCLTP